MIYTDPTGRQHPAPCKYSDREITITAADLCLRDQQQGRQRAHSLLSQETKHCTGCDLIAAYDDADAPLVEWIMDGGRGRERVRDLVEWIMDGGRDRQRADIEASRSLVFVNDMPGALSMLLEVE